MLHNHVHISSKLTNARRNTLFKQHFIVRTNRVHHPPQQSREERKEESGGSSFTVDFEIMFHALVKKSIALSLETCAFKTLSEYTFFDIMFAASHNDGSSIAIFSKLPTIPGRVYTHNESLDFIGHKDYFFLFDHDIFL